MSHNVMTVCYRDLV